MSKRHHAHHPPPMSAVVLTLLLSLSPIISAAHSQEQQPNQESNPISRFRSYLRINTAHPTPDYAAAVNHLTAFAANIPTLQIRTLYLTTPDKPLLLITWPGSNPNLPAVLFNSHLDSVPAEPSKWLHHPFAAHLTDDGKIYARGSQDDKCIGMQYLEAIKELTANLDYTPLRTVHISYVPEEEIGGFDGMMKLVESQEFKELNIGFMLDEGQASVNDEFRVFYADRSPWHLVIKATGIPGHGSRMYDNSAMENMMKSVEIIMKFRDINFDLVKAGLAANSEVISINPVFLKGGIPSPTGFVMNMQPSEVEAGFDLRMPPTVDPDLMRKRIAEEWAPAWRNMTYEITEKGPLRDYMGRPLMTATNASNPWWSIFKEAITAAGGKLAKPEILPSTTDARYVRQMGIPTLGFSPMKNTPILLHDHNEGFVMNMQPSEVEAGFDLRLPPTADPDLMRRRIAEEWAPAWRNMTYEITEKGPLRDYTGCPLMAATNDSNRWWPVFKQAIRAAGGNLAKPEILASTTDSKFVRQLGIPTLGFSPMKNTPILLHDHNEFLQDSVYLEGIKVYEHVIRSLSSFDGASVSEA